MKEKVLTILFTCNGYLANMKKCGQQIIFTGTEEQINQKYHHSGWRYGTSKNAMASNYHVCNRGKHVNPVAGV